MLIFWTTYGQQLQKKRESDALWPSLNSLYSELKSCFYVIFQLFHITIDCSCICTSIVFWLNIILYYSMVHLQTGTFCFSHQFIDIWVVSLFGCTERCCNEHSFVSLCFGISLEYINRNWIPNSYDNSVFNWASGLKAQHSED